MTGTYTFRVTGKNSEEETETKDYVVEFINYYDDVHYTLDDGEETKTVSLGDNTTEYKMLIVKYNKNLTIDSGVTVTANTVDDLTYKKGMFLCVMGEVENNGTISMTARGTYNQEGENVYLWKNKGFNKTQDFEYIPAVGGTGGAGIRTTKNQFVNGHAGEDGTAGRRRPGGYVPVDGGAAEGPGV